MRNLKRALSLTLASVMLLGMMVVGSSAAAGYDDVSKTDNVEAIEVLQAVEVMVGDERGFGPERPVNRAEMAVVMGKLLNLDYDYYATSCPFNDVYDWARGWVGACYANKIVSGRGEGVYDPGATVTAVEAASMLMRALGYFQYANDVVDGFELSTVRQGTKIGIFDQVGSSATEPMTRNQVAQMVLNALQCGVVEPDGNTINLTTPDGTVLTGKVNYVYVTSNKDFARAIGKVGATSVGATNDGSIVELGERLYDGDLKLHDYQIDAFGRPSRQWEYKGTDIGTYIKKELLRQEWTDKVTGKMLYDVLTKSTIEDYDFEITIDGETEKSVLDPDGAPFYGYFTKGNIVRTNTEKVGETGKGVLTQVYVDTDNDHERVYIAIINTYLAKANMDYNEKKDEVEYRVWSVDYSGTPSKTHLVKDKGSKNPTTTKWQDLTVSGDDFDIADVKEDDIVLVHVAEGEIKEIIEPEVLSAVTINAFKNGDWVRSDAQYDYNTTAQYDVDVLDQYSDNNMKDVTFNIYLDEYGYLIGIEQNEDPDQYVFITGNDGGNSDLRNKEADMAAIFLDGTMKVISVNVKDSDLDFSGGAIINTWCTYTVNDKDVYTLKTVPTDLGDGKKAQWAQNVADYNSGNNAGVAAILNNTVNAGKTDSYTIDKAHVALLSGGKASDGAAVDTTIGRVYGNEDTVYINVTTDVINAKTNYIGNPGGTATTTTGNGYAVLANNAADPTNYYLAGTASAGTNLAVIIDDVDSITVGVQNASVEVKDVVAGNYNKSVGTAYTASEVAVPKSEIYTLYNDKGYVIAAVTIGDDQGTSSKYAYVHTDDVKREEYVDGKWNWEREVIIDGEIVTLKEVSDSNWGYIEPLRNSVDFTDTKGMIQGAWYKVSFDANGNVKKAEPYTTFGDKYVDAVGNVETAYDGTTHSEKLIVLEANYTGAGNYLPGNDGSATHPNRDNPTPNAALGRELVYEAGTLWTDKANREGIYIAPNAKIVYSNAKLSRTLDAPTGNFADVSWFDDVNGGYTRSDMDRVLKLIDSNGSGRFYGVITAIVEDGVATSVIINDTYGMAVNQGSETPAPGSGDKYFASVDQNVTVANGLTSVDMSTGNYAINRLTSQITNFSALDADTPAKVGAQMVEFLQYKGYKPLGAVSFSNNTYAVQATDPDGMTVTITMANGAINHFYTVTVDGAKKYLAAGTKLDDAGVTTSKHAKMVLNGVASAIDSGDIGTGNDLAITAGAVYTSDAYTKVTATDVTTAAQITSSTCSYTVSYAIGTGDAVKSATSTYYIGKDATLVATITGDDDMATDFTAASKAKDTITLTATGMTGTGGTAVFGTTSPDTLTEKTITIAGPASTVADVTVSLAGATA